jgi:glycerol-3-phosphate dehydrogenase
VESCKISLSLLFFSTISKLLRILLFLNIHVPLRIALDAGHSIQKFRYRNDSHIQRTVSKRLANIEGLDTENLSIRVVSKIVYLSGRAESYDTVVEAGLKAAKGIPAIIGVVNDLAWPNKSDTPLPSSAIHLSAFRRPYHSNLPSHSGRPTSSNPPSRSGEEPPSDQLSCRTKISKSYNDGKFLPRGVTDERIPTDSYDVVIVGGGITGCAVFRELTRYDLKVLLIEKECDLGCETTKANNGMVHPGLTPKYRSLRHRLNLRGSEMYEALCRELDVPYRRCGTLAVALKPSQLPLRELGYLKGRINGIKKENLEVLDRKQLYRIEPNISNDTLGALWMKNAAITSPFKLTLACGENGLKNGGSILLGTQVTGFEITDNGITAVIAEDTTIPCRLVINAAGLQADRIAALAGAREFTLHPRAGALLVFDSEDSALATHVIAPLSLEKETSTKGGGITPSIDGNLLWGPTAEETSSRDATNVTSAQIEKIMTRFLPFLSRFPAEDIISYFAGVRPASYTEDFIIRPARTVKGMIFACAIQSPGLASAPAIAEEVAALVKTSLGSVREKSDFIAAHRFPPSVRELSEEARNRRIETHPEYGRVVCRCEEVTEGEVLDALHAPVPATTLDGLKRRLRCGMGRCQGGFCTPHLVRILSRTLEMPLEEVTKTGPGSEFFTGRTKVDK